MQNYCYICNFKIRNYNFLRNLVKHLYITVFFVLTVGVVAAQNPDTLICRYQSVRSVGFGFPAVNYSLLSPLNHSGYSLGFHSVRFREMPEHLTQFQMRSEIGILYNDANDSYITLLGFSGGFSRHWQVSEPKQRLQLLFGGSADVGVNVYMKEDNTNNPLAYFFNLSVSPNILFKYDFKVQKSRFGFGLQLGIPLVSLVSTSDYSSTLPPAVIEPEANFFDAIRLASLGSLRKYVAITTLDITSLSERHHKMPVIRITYLFSGMNYRFDDFVVKSVNHQILFGTIFHLFQ